MSLQRIGSVLVLPTFLVCGVVSACGSDEEGGVVTSFVPNGETITIQALDNSFRPVEFEITAGTEVVFENRGRNDHNILPDAVANDEELTTLLAGGEGWGVVAAEFVPGDTYTHTFDVPGTYTYYCSIHGSPGAGMYGSLVVTDPGEG
ncbi:MAG: plastocyanin/azurin family copper-binding protein [Actinomycetota bacterium]